MSLLYQSRLYIAGKVLMTASSSRKGLAVMISLYHLKEDQRISLEYYQGKRGEKLARKKCSTTSVVLAETALLLPVAWHM